LKCRWPRGLRRVSAAAPFQELRVWVLPWALMCVVR